HPCVWSYLSLLIDGISHPFLRIKQFILGSFSAAEKSIIKFQRITTPVRQCCWTWNNLIWT
ncbi:MAG: hypothetical protein OSB08_06555, partial [SAR324 cluster bacterium]|nr:hypothetical protein [SAR324 cluster bacterium]